MTDWSQSNTDILNFFGPEPADLWGVMVWGTGKWGYGDFKLPCNIGSVSTMSTFVFSDAFLNNPDAFISESQALTGLGTSEKLLTGNGYYYVFPGPSTDEESDHDASYTSGSAQSTSWTSAAAAGGSWS